ncbi:hypothetical protein LPJ72_003415 [Coemansia sp. Benny D160-2]|nr:hypothetical protein LPJ72_003415 [Coemansia sp. Benny D160-2]
MFCNRCGEISTTRNCSKCGGRAAESTTSAAAIADERRDPWTSVYLQRRLNSTTTTPNASPSRPLSTAYLPSATTYGVDHARHNDSGPLKPVARPLTGSPKLRYGAGAADAGLAGWAADSNDLQLPRPRPVRDATGPRPASMYATGAMLEAPVQSAIERTVAKKPSRRQMFGESPDHSPATSGGDRPLRSKWSQYFTSSASPQQGSAVGGRGRSESFNAPAVQPASVADGRAALGVSRPGYQLANEPALKTRASVGAPYASPAPEHRRSLAPDARPFSSDGGHAGMRKLSGAFDGHRALARTQQQYQSQHVTRTHSPLMNTALQDAQRSRSATLPETRVCATCSKQLRAEEQRQFASKPGIVYCGDCYHSSYSRGHCAGCSKIVLTHGRPWVQHGDRVWHKLCIKCASCNKLLITPLIDLTGAPTCEPCFSRAHPGERPRLMPRDDQPPAHPLSSASQLRRPRHASSASDAAAAAAAGSTMARSSYRSHTGGHAAPAASIPTPALTDDGRSSSAADSAVASVVSKLGGMRIVTDLGIDTDADMMRIMSPVEVAAKEGLPPPRSIVDPDIGALSRDEVSAPAPVAAARPPLSPSLKNPNSPTARTASPRSVSFRIDEPPLSESRLAGEASRAEAEAEAVAEEVAATQRSVTLEPAPTPPARTLADYVRSKTASPAASRTHSRMPSVAETIKKFSSGAARESSATSAATLDKNQLPGLDDLLRTHQREPPTEPTIPTIDNHSKLLKSRPRNQKKRRPSQTPAAIYDSIVAASAPGESDSKQQQQTEGTEDDQFAPNQCARCNNSIDDTWFRLSDGRQVHVECFSCQGCSALIDDGVYVVEDGVEYHPQCVPPAPPIVSVSPVPSSQSSRAQSSAQKPRGPRAPRREEACDRCRAALSGPRFQLTNGKQYHPECFACAGCGQRFDEGSYVCFEGQEFHHQCVEKFAAAASTANAAALPSASAGASAAADADAEHLVCGQCERLIEGVFLRHNDAVFHPDCFCCIDCRRAITPGMPFGEIGSRPCCEACLEQRMAAAAAADQQSQRRQNGWPNSAPYYPAAKTGGY